ncbi:hypothetical protein LAUMK191_02563 [Mycobacterium attenuatum]|uniref:hypothetical protein n=1 Tax=Mycobacterium attenuatum TaxID=2341086 RepID=UPI000F1C1673|nr:hypothetical protein [Mycobacterium attenuatum]VBA52760.1 hypothetical protein LAUMK191_02563 [Mycobacterium attenuatum]
MNADRIIERTTSLNMRAPSDNSTAKPQNYDHAVELERDPRHFAKWASRKRCAAMALGALALTSGVTGTVDAMIPTADGATIGAGRLTIALAARHGFKLDTCTTSGSNDDNSTINQGATTTDFPNDTAGTDAGNSGNSNTISSYEPIDVVGEGGLNAANTEMVEIPDNPTDATNIIVDDNINIVPGGLDNVLDDNNVGVANNNNNVVLQAPGIMWPDDFPRWANLNGYDPGTDPDQN